MRFDTREIMVDHFVNLKPALLNLVTISDFSKSIGNMTVKKSVRVLGKEMRTAILATSKRWATSGWRQGSFSWS